MLGPTRPTPTFARLVGAVLALGLLTGSGTARAAPGDVLFSDDFENGSLGTDWSVTANGGDAGVGTHTANSGSYSMYTRWDEVTVTSRAVDLSGTSAVELAVWVRRGSDTFSEWPENTNEDLELEYLTSGGAWTTLKTYRHGSPEGEIFDETIMLPADALHAGFRLRFHQIHGDGTSGCAADTVSDCDYWHVDDVVLTETTIPTGGFCEDFESGFGRWTESGSGDAGISGVTYSSASNSAYLRWDTVNMTSETRDLSGSSGSISYWVQRGDDDFSEDPDWGEDLIVEYYTSGGSWQALDTFSGWGAGGETFDRTHTLPADAKHTGFRLRFRTTGGSGSDFDYWHVDDVCVGDATFPQPDALAYYAMDESAWTGAAGEVGDGSGNGNHGTAVGGADTVDPGKVCLGGDIPNNTSSNQQDAVDTGIDVNDGIGNQGTIDFWYKSNARWNGNRGDRQLFDASTQVYGNANDKYFFLVLRNNSRLRFALEDSSDGDHNVDSGNNNFRAGEWVHIAVTWDLPNDRLALYINGSLEDTATPNTNGSLGDVGPLYLGDNSSGYITSGATGNSANGVLDEVRIYSEVLNDTQIQQDMNATHPCVQLDHFVIGIGGGTASTCTPRAITITAEDSSGNTLSTYGGTVDLSTSSTHGTWSANTANGTLSDATADDGAASYTFDSADNGSVVLDLTNVHADDLTITATDSSAGVSSTSSTLSFRDNAFVVEPTDALGTEVVAGRGHGMKAELWRRDPSTGNCSIATGYAGSKGLKAWLTRTGSDPGGTAPTVGGTPLPDSAPGANNLSLSFSAGVANFTLDTTDVGQYAVNLRDDTSGFAQDTAGNARAIDGGSGDLTVRPFGLAIDNVIAGATPNPGADTPSGSIFTAAGASFAADVTAVAWQSGDDGNDDGVPDTGADLTDNATTLSYAWATGLTATAPFEPAAGSLGAINNGSLAAGDFTGGQATATGLQYTEVGSMTLQADATGYLGASGVAITGKSGVVGRFTPDHFDVTVNSPTFAPGCGTFTYLDQALSYATAPQLTITAKNALGGTTVNYYDFGTGADWWRLADINHATDVSYTDSGMPGAVSIDATGAGHSPAWDSPTSQGQLVTTFNGPLYYMRPTGSAVAPFNASMQGSVSVTDADGVSASSNPVTFTIGFDPNNPEQRHGRMSLANAHGSELLDLDVPVAVEYYAGGSTGFVTNADDGCTTLASGDVTLSNFQDGLSSGDTSVTSTSLSNGSGTVTLSASDPATGSVDVTVDLSASSETWLRYDWDGDGTLDDPTARATFGIFNREEQWIYQRELY